MSNFNIQDPRWATTMFPLMATEGTVGFESIRRDEVKKLINSHLKMLLLTNPGELISDPEFGVGLYQLLFLNELEERIVNLKVTIDNQIRAYLPYLGGAFQVKVDTTVLDSGKLGVQISYKINNELSASTLTFIAAEGSLTVYNSPATQQQAATAMTLGQILAER